MAAVSPAFAACTNVAAKSSVGPLGSLGSEARTARRRYHDQKR